MPVGLVELVFIILIPVVMVALLYLLIRAAVRGALGPRKRLEEELGVEVLRDRLARGEISPEEFEEGKRLLGAK